MGSAGFIARRFYCQGGAPNRQRKKVHISEALPVIMYFAQIKEASNWRLRSVIKLALLVLTYKPNGLQYYFSVVVTPVVSSIWLAWLDVSNIW